MQEHTIRIRDKLKLLMATLTEIAETSLYSCSTNRVSCLGTNSSKLKTSTAMRDKVKMIVTLSTILRRSVSSATLLLKILSFTLEGIFDYAPNVHR